MAMGPHIRNGKRCFLALTGLAISIHASYAQTPPAPGQCLVSAVPTTVRAEGFTERLGDIVLQCSGYTPGAALSGNITIFLPISVTNRVDANGNAQDAVLSVDSGSGFFTPTPAAGRVNNQSISFNGFSFTAPASGNVNLKLSSIRGAANQLGALRAQPVTASISTSIPVNQAQVVVAYAQPGLYATLYSTGIVCRGSPVPGSLSVSNLFAAGTNFASTRVTEGFASTFQPRGLGDDNGTRLLVKYSGFPAATQLYVPTFVAGSDAQVPTAGGDLGLAQNVGQYVPGSGTLLLSLVQYADSTGASGYAILPSSPAMMNSVSAVPLTNGSGYAVYEVMDANPYLQESAQFPTFIGLPNVTANAVAQESISFAPVSSAPTASATAPVPRFAATAPASDCSLIGDCNANYFPKLSAQGYQLSLTGVSGGAMTSPAGYVTINNAAGGLMNWSVGINYLSGTGWLSADNTAGQTNATVFLRANPKSLAAGAYTANVIVDAGPLAGNATFPVTLTVSAAPTTPTNPTNPTTPANVPAVSAIVNAASFAAAPLVAGSLTTLVGTHLGGQTVAVTFDNNPATVIYSSASQINLAVPAALAGSASTSMVVTVDGASSAPQTVPVAPAWPAIFANGAFNQDNSVNSPSTPARVGDVLQLFATGIPANATVSVLLGQQNNLTPYYAGPAPGLTGVQQVNVAVPSSLSTGMAPLAICVAAGSQQQFCSTGYPLYIK